MLNHNIENHERICKDIELNLENDEPEYQRLIQKKKELLEADSQIDTVVSQIECTAKERLQGFMDEFELFMESVEYNGIFDLLEYSKRLRKVVSKLASMRLNSCHSIAAESTTKYLETLTNEKIHSLKVQPQAINLDLIFESEDKLVLMQQYLPSVALFSASLLTYRSMLTGLLKNTGKMGKLITGCIGLIGIMF